MKRHLMRRKATACLLILAMLFSFAGGMCLSPGAVQAEEATGDFKLIVGHYRGLKQEVTVPVTVHNATNLVALEFRVESQSDFSIDFAVASVERGDDLPGEAQLTWSGIGHGNLKIAIYMHEEGSAFSGDGELVRITYTHNGTEQSYRQPIDLIVPTAAVGAWMIDNDVDEGEEESSNNGLIQLPITQNSVRDGQVMVAIMYGDMNKDDKVTISDALLILQASVGDLPLTPQLKDAADVKRDPGTEHGTITVYDALLVARYSLGLIEWFPVNYNLFIIEDPVDDNGDPATTPFNEPPSSIWIGDKQMGSTRTTIGGTVTFNVKFDDPVEGHIRVQIGDLNGTEEINGTEQTVTLNVSNPQDNLYAGTGNHEVSVYQYNPLTHENGVPLRRFVKVVDPDKYPPPELLITDLNNGVLELTWEPVLAASSIELLQSFDHGEEKTWLPALNLLEPILSYDESARVTDLDPNRGYYYKLEIDGGVHDGDSNVVSFKRMSGEAIAEQAGADLYVSILYTGSFQELNLAAAGDFMLVKNGMEIKAPEHIELLQPGAMGIMLLFEGTEEENFSVTYNETAGSLDLDEYSYVLSEDSVEIGEAGPINEVTVSSRSFFLSALANDSIERIYFAADITLNDGETASLTVDGQLIDGQGFTLDGDLDVSGTGAQTHDLTIDGDLEIAPGATDFKLDNCIITADMAVNEDMTFRGGGYGSAAVVTVADGAVLTFEAGDGKVNNEGELVVEGTAAIAYTNDMATDLENAIGITGVSFDDVAKGIASTTPAAFDLSFTLAGMKVVSGAEITVGLGQLTLTPGAFELTLDGDPVTSPAVTGVNAVAGTADAELDAIITIITGTEGLDPGQYMLSHAEGIATSADVDETVTAIITAGGIGFEFTYDVGSP